MPSPEKMPQAEHPPLRVSSYGRLNEVGLLRSHFNRIQRCRCLSRNIIWDRQIA